MFLMSIVCQFQLLLIVSNPTLSSISKETNSSEVLKSFYQTFFWEDLESINERTSSVLFTLGIIGMYLLVHAGVAIYLIVTISLKKDPGTKFQGLWKALMCI